MLVAVGHLRCNYFCRSVYLVVVHLFKHLFLLQHAQLFVMGFGPFIGVKVAAGFRGGLWWVEEAFGSGAERDGVSAAEVPTRVVGAEICGSGFQVCTSEGMPHAYESVIKGCHVLD